MSAQHDNSRKRTTSNLKKSQTLSSSTDPIISKDSEASSSLLQSLISGYKSRTSPECKSIDAFLAFTVLTGISQLLYCFITRGFPYNSFIGVFSASIGSFVFAANSRLQMTRKPNISKLDSVHIIIEFLVCFVLLNVFVANFIG